MRPRPYDLVAFDVDGTLIHSRDGRVVWQLLNARFDAEHGGQRSRFAAYLNKEITYAQWVDLDIGAWQAAGATRQQLAAEIRAGLRLVPGARQAVQTLKRRGYKLAVISGTIDLTLQLLFAGHPFDVVHTNRIWFDDQGRIARWRATPYDMDGKDAGLRAVAQELGVPLGRTAYVGDNFNDLSVMRAAGLAVAFEPKVPELHQVAHEVIEGDLRRLLPLLP